MKEKHYQYQNNLIRVEISVNIIQLVLINISNYEKKEEYY